MKFLAKIYKASSALGLSIILLETAEGNFLDKLDQGRKALEESLRSENSTPGFGDDISPQGPRKIKAERPQKYLGTTLSGRFAEYMIFHESTIFKQIEVLYEGFADKSNLQEAARSLNSIYKPQSYDDRAERTNLKDFYFSAQMISEDADPRRTVTEVSNAVNARNVTIGGQKLRELYTVPFDPSTLNIFWEAQKQVLPAPDAELIMDAVEMYLPAYDLLLTEVDKYLTLKRTSNGRTSYAGFRPKYLPPAPISNQISEHATVNGYFPLFFSGYPLGSIYGSQKIEKAISRLPVIQLETVILIGEFFLKYPSIFLHGNQYQRENDIDVLVGILDNANIHLNQKRGPESGEFEDETGNGSDESEIETDSGNSLNIEGLDL